MALDGLMFDNSILSPFVVKFVRSKASVHPRISDVVIINEVVKVVAFEFIGRRHTKNWMILCESHRDWF